MSEVNSFSAYYNRKIQLDQYEPVTYGAELDVEVGEDEDWQEAYHEAVSELEREVEEEIARRVTDKKLGAQEDDG